MFFKKKPKMCDRCYEYLKELTKLKEDLSKEKEKSEEYFISLQSNGFRVAVYEQKNGELTKENLNQKNRIMALEMELKVMYSRSK